MAASASLGDDARMVFAIVGILGVVLAYDFVELIVSKRSLRRPSTLS